MSTNVLPTPVNANQQTGVPFSTTGWESAVGTATNSAVAVTTPLPTAGMSCCVGSIDVSYSATPTSGLVSIVDNLTTVTVYQAAVVAGGITPIKFTPPRRTSGPNGTFTIQLSAAGSGVTGYLNALCWQEQ